MANLQTYYRALPAG